MPARLPAGTSLLLTGPPATTLRQFRTQARAGALHAERFAIVTSATAGETDSQPSALAKAGRTGRVQSFPAPTVLAATVDTDATRGGDRGRSRREQLEGA